MINLKIKKLSKTAIIPTKAYDTDACFDIYANLQGEICYDWVYNRKLGQTESIQYDNAIKIEPGESYTIDTGFCTEIPEGYFAPVFCRSGMGIKRGLRLANSVGIIDSSYRGEWKVCLHNDSDKTQIIFHGDRIAQFTLLPVFNINIEEVEYVDETERGEGGFGSSGW